MEIRQSRNQCAENIILDTLYSLPREFAMSDKLPEIFWEIHRGLPREGPGDNKSTRRAYLMLKDLPRNPRILDVGCGPGMQTVELAKLSEGQIDALDNYQLFLDQLDLKI